MVFLAALGIFVAVTAVLCYGIGKVINAHMNKEDGPTSKWTKTVDIRQLGNLPSNPEMQNKVAELTQQFPTPRVQTDDGNQDVADLHAREDLLLDNYSWVDASKGKVRIPIERAMELIAQRGLPVAPAVQTGAADDRRQEAGGARAADQRVCAAPAMNRKRQQREPSKPGRAERASRRRRWRWTPRRDRDRIAGTSRAERSRSHAERRHNPENGWRDAAAVAAACAALLRCTAVRAGFMAQVSSYGDKQTGPSQRPAPSILNGVGIAQHLNQQLPLEPDVHRRRGQAGAAGQTTSASGPRFSRWFTTTARCFARKSWTA